MVPSYYVKNLCQAWSTVQVINLQNPKDSSYEGNWGRQAGLEASQQKVLAPQIGFLAGANIERQGKQGFGAIDMVPDIG